MYLDALDYMFTSRRGIAISSDYETGYQYFPVLRIKDYIIYTVSKRLPNQFVLMLKTEVNNRKTDDRNFDNPDGIIDFDLFMSCYIGITRMCLSSEITYFKAIFNACDMNENGVVEFDDLKIFFKRIQKVTDKDS